MLLSSAASAALLASRALSTKDAAVRTVTTTIHPEYTTTYVIEGQTGEVVVVGSPGVVEVGGITTTLEIPAVKTHTRVYGTTIDIEIEPQPLGRNFEFIGKYSGGYFTEGAPFITTWMYPGTLLELSIPEQQTTFIFTGAVSTEVAIPPERTHLTVDGIETAVDLPGLTTLIETSESTSVTFQLLATTTTLEIGAETFGFTVRPDTIYGYGNVRFCGTKNAQTLTNRWGAVLGGPCIVGTTFTVTLPSSAGDLYLHADGFTTALTLPGITTTFVPEQTITIIKGSSAETSVIPAVVSSYVTTISDTNVSSGESSTVSTTGPITITVTAPDSTEPGSDFTVSQSVYTSDGSVYTTDVEVPITNPNGTVSQTQSSDNVPTAPAGSLNTACSVVPGPLSDEDVALLDVIFNSGIDGTTYAQWLVNYAFQLLAQVDNVAVHAMADPNGQYTTAFNSIDITGILGLASAAPMYSCFLSSLWDEALRNPSGYAKRDTPGQDEKTKLIVLFERRSDSNGDYNLAELLLDETDNLLAEMNSVIAGQPLDLERLTGRHLLVVALNAPIATEGLNDAIRTALASYYTVATDDNV